MQRILVVDGDAESREIIARVLSREGYAVEVAGTVAEARKLCAGGRIDLLVADVELPDGDGWSLIRDLVRECGQRGVALSAHARAVDEQRSLDAGFSAHVIKPISLALLTEFVRSTLSPAPEPPGPLEVRIDQSEIPAPADAAPADAAKAEIPVPAEISTAASRRTAERRKRAMELLRESERALVREAASLTAAGVNTSGLAGPMIGLQQALAELQAVDVEAPDVEANRIRGRVDPTG